MKFPKLLLLASLLLAFVYCTPTAEPEPEPKPDVEDPDEPETPDTTEKVDYFIKVVDVQPAIADSGVPTKGETYLIDVDANIQWDIEATSEGLEAFLSVVSDSTLVVEVAKNTVESTRDLSVLLKAVEGDTECEWTAVQAAAAPVEKFINIVSCTPAVKETGVPFYGENYTIGVEANVAWEIESVSEGAEATMKITSDTVLVVSVKRNYEVATRDIKVVIKQTDGDKTAEWTATQEIGEPKDETVKPRLIVTTDINVDKGDPDDRQSLGHLLYYADLFDIKAILLDRPNDGGPEAVELCVDAYRTDYNTPGNRFREKGLPEPDFYEPLVYSVKDAATLGLIAKIADESDEPLYIAAWGCLEAVKVALQARPDLVGKLRVLAIGTEMKSPYDTQNCGERNWNDASGHRAAIFNDDRFNNLWMIENNWGYNGMFEGEKKGYPGEFLKTLQSYGALGQHLTDCTLSKPWATYFRIGDTPTIMYFIDNDNLDNPLEYNLGGYFIKPDPDKRPNYYIDAAPNSTWNYADPCSTWSEGKAEVDARSAEMTLRRDVMYDDMLERINYLYNK